MIPVVVGVECGERWYVPEFRDLSAMEKRVF